MKTPIPNRLVQTPDDVYERLDEVWKDEHKRMRVMMRMAYGRGYMDGYRDGHTDAENGHDERVRVSLA